MLIRCVSVVCLAMTCAACNSQHRPPPPAPAAVRARSDAGPTADEERPTRHLRLVPAPDGSVAPLVRNLAEQSEREHRRLLVYVGATWCEPCRRFHSAAAAGDLDATFGDVDLVVFDLDRDGERLRAASYASRYIPLFAIPADDGSASGRQIEGAIKGDGAVAFIVPRLEKLLGR